MSTVIKATCVSCGDIKTSIENVTLRYLKETAYGDAHYRFVCPKCKMINLKPCSPEIANILFTAGVEVERYELPIELLERPNDDRPVITLDDVLDLHQEMEDENWIQKLGWSNGE